METNFKKELAAKHRLRISELGFRLKPDVYVCCVDNSSTGRRYAALHIALPHSAAQCQSLVWIKEEGDDKSLCC